MDEILHHNGIIIILGGAGFCPPTVTMEKNRVFFYNSLEVILHSGPGYGGWSWMVRCSGCQPCAFVCFDKVIFKGYNPDLVSVTVFFSIHLGRMQLLSYTHRIHVWYIYLHLAWIMVNAGKYTMYTWMLWVISEVPVKSLASRRADSC